MTTAHVEKFAELIGKDPALFAKLKVTADAAAAAASAAAFITNAVKEAKALGLEFTEEEAREYLAEESKAEAEGALSDTQLEAVAGGKGVSGYANTAAYATYVGTGQQQRDIDWVADQFPGSRVGGRSDPNRVVSKPSPGYVRPSPYSG